MPLQLLSVIVLGLMCGSEMNVAVFGHPTLNKQPLKVHIPVRASLAMLFGRISLFGWPFLLRSIFFYCCLSGTRTGLSGASM
jgi:hypothetical protein